MFKAITLSVISLGLLLIGVTNLQAEELQVESNNGIDYVTGGIGDSEQQALQEMASDFNLGLIFAVRESGNYLNDIDVQIQDSAGELVLETTSKGPMLYADLEPGSYNVEASGYGETYNRTVDLQEGQQETLNFTWPQDVVPLD
jgi:hypothetical protein